MRLFQPFVFRISILSLAIMAAAGCAHPQSRQSSKPAPIPVILDTDIGDDIDDTWALGFLLRSPELDLKLVVGDDGKAQYRARLLAKFLARAGRSDVPVGIGLDIPRKRNERQLEWIKDFDLKQYPGKVHQDGVQAIIDTVMKSPRPVTLICIGPVPNIAAALKREPRIAQHAHFVGMHGAVRVGYNDSTNIIAEYNVKEDIAACQAAFSAPWNITITPLDTCDKVSLSGERYQRILQSKDPIATDIITNYRLWANARGHGSPEGFPTHSTTLFDTVAVYLAFTQACCQMETINLRVTDDGLTVIDPKAKPINVAVSWKDLEGFEDLLIQRLTNAH